MHVPPKVEGHGRARRARGQDGPGVGFGPILECGGAVASFPGVFGVVLSSEKGEEMKWNISGEKTCTTIVLAVVVCIAAMMLTIGLTTWATARSSPTPASLPAGSGAGADSQLVQYATGSHTYVVKPNGHDDTADIQAAFNACTSSGSPCTVQLVKGTYYTAQITVFGFRGSFVGMGQGVTTIQALPNLPSPTADPFWAALPGPQNPWPALFTFENGTYRISGMTLTEPYSDAVSPGWDASVISGPNPETALLTLMELTGLQAFAAVDHVAVLGAAGDAFGTNVYNAITFEGSVLPQSWTNPLADVIPLSGALSVTNSVFNSTASAPWVDTIVNAEVTVCYNTIVNSPTPLGFSDASNSQLLFCGNHVSGVEFYTAFEGLQSENIPGLLPSTVYVTDNDFRVSDGANAVWLEDFGPVNFGTAPTLTAVVSGNVFQTDTSCGCYVGSLPGYYSVLLSISLASFVVSNNMILSGGAAGVYVDGGPGVVSGNTILGSYVGVSLNSTDGVHVTGNVIKNSAWWGIALTNGSSYNLVAFNLVKESGEYDLYWDETGSHNLWVGNVYKTAYPSWL
jgi:hypothetical protein